MRILTLLAIAILLTSIGCSTTASQQDAEKPPKHAKRVQVAIYDSTNRSKKSYLDIYDAPSQVHRPFKEIALLTCEGAPKEEAAMMTAIVYRARMLGADAVMSANTAVTQQGGPVIRGWGGGIDTRCVFRARAIVYEGK